jgi:hypothetical protein
LGSSLQNKNREEFVIMKKKSDNRILGMTQTQLLILFAMGGLLLCIIVLFGWYINSSNSVVVPPPTSMSQSGESSNTPIPLPIFTTTPTNIPASIFASGGLGLSQSDWEKTHFKADLGYLAIGTGYDGKYDVMFRESNIWYIERQWSMNNAVTSDVVMAESQGLIPTDSQFIKTYSPEGRPETVVNLYFSESLKSRFNSEDFDSWIGGESGNFTVQYNQYEYGITRMIIALGNNP